MKMPVKSRVSEMDRIGISEKSLVQRGRRRGRHAVQKISSHENSVRRWIEKQHCKSVLETADSQLMKFELKINVSRVRG